jgi:hypothetical protein
MGDTIQVRTTTKQNVEKSIAQQLCGDFLDWLDTQGFVTETRSTVNDGRSYAELAAAYIATFDR